MQEYDIYSILSLSRCGDYSPHPLWNRTCAINAYGSASHIRIFMRILCAPLPVFSALLSAQRFLFDRAVECATLPSTCFHRFLQYYDDIGLPATRLLVLRLFRRLTSYTLPGCNGTSAVPITHLRESLLTSASASPCSQTGGCLSNLATIGQSDIACCHTKNIGQIPLNNHFPALSLRLRYGSAAPCPTLRVGVTASLPRTRYGRLARPYPTGLPCCDVINLQRSLAQPVENSLVLFSQLALINNYNIAIGKHTNFLENNAFLFCTIYGMIKLNIKFLYCQKKQPLRQLFSFYYHSREFNDIAEM